MIGTRPKAILIDVREPDELPKLEGMELALVPLAQIETSATQFMGAEEIYLFCQSGIRSMKAVNILQQKLVGKKIYS
ncbi:rhodanese-like domain-containing protein, partial [Metamycoplasma hominis]|uniref:rhodanese-like domain-containing protein n=1 Tax=Metamycoplasma hominis TaxID=2098 RepID=UPI00358F825A